MRATLEKARGRQMRIVLDALKIANRHRGDVVLGEQREPFRGRLRRRLARDFAVDEDRKSTTYELQSLMRNSYDVFCSKNKTQQKRQQSYKFKRPYSTQFY